MEFFYAFQKWLYDTPLYQDILRELPVPLNNICFASLVLLGLAAYLLYRIIEAILQYALPVTADVFARNRSVSADSRWEGFLPVAWEALMTMKITIIRRIVIALRIMDAFVYDVEQEQKISKRQCYNHFLKSLF